MAQLKEMEPLLGSRVKVTCRRSGQTVYGTLQFVGYNDSFPSWGLTCTVDRLPGIRINSVVEIELVEP